MIGEELEHHLLGYQLLLLPHYIISYPLYIKCYFFIHVNEMQK